MKKLDKLSIGAILLVTVVFMISGVARSEETPTIPASSIAFVAKATPNRDCLAVYSEPNGSSKVVRCLQRCRKVTLTGKSKDVWVEISAPISGWVNGLFLDPNPRICNLGSYAGVAPYDGDDPSDDPGDYYDWWSSPGWAWYWGWWWHYRHNPFHFFAHHHPGHHHGHYKSAHAAHHPARHAVRHFEKPHHGVKHGGTKFARPHHGGKTFAVHHHRGGFHRAAAHGGRHGGRHR